MATKRAALAEGDDVGLELGSAETLGDADCELKGSACGANVATTTTTTTTALFNRTCCDFAEQQTGAENHS
jgi:hypothetical protein